MNKENERLTNTGSLEEKVSKFAQEKKDNNTRLLEENYLNSLNHFGSGRTFEY